MDWNTYNAKLEAEQLSEQLKTKVDLPKRGGDLPMSAVARPLLKMLIEYCSRMRDALALYRPISQTALDFHACRDRTRLLSGSNQAGKTLCVSAEVARIWRGKDPHRKRCTTNLRLLAVGKDEDHVGQVMWKKLWWPGAFFIVPDELTGLWRAVRPDPNNPRALDPIDMEREKLWQMAPPLIHPSEIKELAWNKKNQNVPKLVRLHNGSECLFHTSKGSPRQGIELDLFWPDEEIENREWIPESQARLLRRDGMMVASFTPQASTPEYYALHRRVQAGEENISEFNLLLEDNPYVPAKAKQELFKDLQHDPEQLQVRYYGKYAIAGRMVYPQWSLLTHGVEPFEIPDDWMRILVVDPGSHFQAAIAAAIPPKANEIHIYREWLLRNSTAASLAQQVADVTGDWRWETFLIDFRGGRQRAMGHSNTIADHYSEQFAKQGLSSRLSGSSFEWSSDEIGGREQSLKAWLAPRTEGGPLLKVHTCCKSLDHQMKDRYYRKDSPDKRDDKARHDVTDCLEYLAAYFDGCRGITEHGLYYHLPVVVAKDKGGAYQAYQARLKARRRQQTGGQVITLGPAL